MTESLAGMCVAVWVEVWVEKGEGAGKGKVGKREEIKQSKFDVYNISLHLVYR